MTEKKPTRKTTAKKPAPPPVPEPEPVVEEVPEVVVEEVAAPVSTIPVLLAMEDMVRDEARAYPSGDNSDAVKYQLRAVASAINNLRDSIREVGNLER